jgi:sugar fermentation stimulation protein A
VSRLRIRDPLIEAKFLRRLNRFTVQVSTNHETQAYLPNPGRLRELLTPGATLLLARRELENRKTSYDTIAVQHNNLWVCIDSRIPNHLIHQALLEKQLKEFRNYTEIRPEYSYGASRIDFLLTGAERALLEVKGCTLVRGRTALFPDAPTKRGTKHLTELISAHSQGFRACMFFLIQRPDADYFAPNDETDPDFAATLRTAQTAGVEIITYTSTFQRSRITLNRRIPVLNHA